MEDKFITSLERQIGENIPLVDKIKGRRDESLTLSHGYFYEKENNHITGLSIVEKNIRILSDSIRFFSSKFKIFFFR